MRTKLTFLPTLLLVLLGILQSVALSAQSYLPKVGEKVTVDDVVYLVKGDNLVTNPEFNDGLAGWKAGDGSDLSADYFEIQPTGGPDGSACVHALGGAGSGKPQSIKTGWAVEEGKTYVFSCWAYRTQGGMSSNTQYSRLYSSSSETATNTQIGTIQYEGNKWVQTQILFTASAPYVVVNLGWLNAASSFDCFFLGEVEATSDVSTAKLEKAIASAENLLATTTEGDERGQYPATARQALSQAIATAQGVLQNPMQETIDEATTTLLAAIDAYKAAVVPAFQVGVGYNFTNVASGSLALTTGGGTVQIVAADMNDSTQVFYFLPAPEGAEKVGYNLRDANGNYVFRSGSWDTKSGADADLTKADAIFNVVDYGSYIQIKNEGSGSVMGVDKTDAGSPVFSNKNGQDGKNYWYIQVHTPTAVLSAVIAEAKKLLADTEVGTEYWQVSQTAYDELTKAVAIAEEALKNITSYEEANVQVETLNNAIAAFKDGFNPLTEFDATQTYVVTHSSGNLLSATVSGSAVITAKPEEGAADLQLMTLEEVAYEDLENVYRIRSVADGTYLMRDGSYNTLWSDKDTTAAYLQVVRLEGKYLGLKFATTNTFLGSDGTASGTALYSDKAGAGNANAYFTITAYVGVKLDRVAFNAALEKANNAANAMVEGYKKGQYFAEDIAAFRAAIAAARTKANKAASQEELDAVTTDLLATIDTYVGKAHAEDVINKDSLTVAIAAAETVAAQAVAGDFDKQYPQAAIDTYKAAIAEAKAVLNNGEATQEQLDAATEALKAAGELFAKAQVTIDYAALTAQVTEANQVLEEAKPFKGEGPGKYPEAAFTALQDAVAHADRLKSDNQCNQATVDAEVETLKAAIAVFKATYVPCDYTELNELLAEAKELIRQATAGEIACDPDYLQDLKDSYAKNAKALESTNQDDIDLAVKKLRRDIAIFKDNVEATGIVAIGGRQLAIEVSQGALSIGNLPAGARVHVLTVNGQLVSTSAHTQLNSGVYLVRINVSGATVVKKVSVR